MKKKILLTLLVVMVFTCLLAISVNAAEYDKTETVTVTLANGTQECALYDANGNALVWYTLDDGATVQSVKTADLVTASNGTTSIAANGSLSHIYLGETALQIHNQSTTNHIVVANFRDCTFTKVTHSSYKATFSDSKVIQYVYMPNTINDLGCNIFQNCSNLKVCDIPSDASFRISDSNNFPNCTSLKEINLLGCTSFTGHSNFSGCTSLTKVLVNSSTITWTSISTNVFNGAPLTQFGLIEGECTIPASTTSIGNAAFVKSRFEKITMPDTITSFGWNVFASNPNLKEVDLPTGLTTSDIRVFMDCTSLETVKDLENCGLTTIPTEYFKNTALKKVVVSNIVTSIGQDAFGSIDELEEIVLGAALTGFVSYNAFVNSSSLKVVYMPSTLTKMTGNTIFNKGANNLVFYYTGTKAQLEQLISASTKASAAVFFDAYNDGANALTLAEYNALTDEQKAGDRYIVYGYSPCEAFYEGNHTVETETCSGVCSVVGCGYFAIVDETKHNELANLMFGIDIDADGIDDEFVSTVNYYANMYVFHVCEYCNTKLAEDEAYGSVFEQIGYSSDEETSNTISFFTSVNHKALNKYEEMAEVELQYGLVVSGIPTDSPIIDVVDGEVKLAAATVNVSMTNTEYTKFSVKVMKLQDGQQLNCCGYVLENDTITYLGALGASNKAEIIYSNGEIVTSNKDE